MDSRDSENTTLLLTVSGGVSHRASVDACRWLRLEGDVNSIGMNIERERESSFEVDCSRIYFARQWVGGLALYSFL